MRIGSMPVEHCDQQRALAKELITGDLIYFKEEKKPYRIRARNNDYIICTKPYNPKKTFLYSIVNLKEGVRGTDNYYCRYEYTDAFEAKQGLMDLISGEIEVSHRRRIALHIRGKDEAI